MSARNGSNGKPALFLAVAVFVGFFAGCLSGPAPVDHYYRIETRAPAALPQPAVAGTVEVERLRVEAVSQGRRMLYLDAGSPGEISQHRYHHWADPPNLMLQAELVEYLQAAEAFDRVVTPAVHVESDYRITGRLIRLDRTLGSGNPRVNVAIELALIRNSDDEVLVLETYREEREAGGSQVVDSVVVYGDALSSVYERFVADIQRS